VRLIHDGRILFKNVTETGQLREALTQNLSIDRDDFDTIPLLQRRADGERPIERSKAGSRRCWWRSMRL
jgi:hypothetical protein